MSEWKDYKFSDLLLDESISYGIVQPGSHINNNSVPIIRENNIKNGNIKTDDVMKVAISVEEKYKRTRLIGGELLITVVGNVGECAIVPIELKGWNVARAVGVARIKDSFNKFYIKYLFKTEDIKFQMYGSTNDSVQPTLNLSLLKNLNFTLPPIKEQDAIVSILSSLDDKIDLLQRQNKTLERLAETLFRQWFVEEAEESWEQVTIGDVDRINSKTISKNYTFDDIEYLDTGSITEGRVSGFQSYKLNDAPSRAQRVVQDNDIVYSFVRPIQRHYGLLSDKKANAVASTGICVITCDTISPYFIYLLLTRTENVEYLDSIAEGSTSTYPSLKPLDIANFEFSKPPDYKLN